MDTTTKVAAIAAARNAGDLGAAESLCREWLDDQPDAAEAHRAFGLIAEAAGRLPEAVASLRQAEQCRPDADILFDLGRLLLVQYREGVRDGTLREPLNLSLTFGELDFPATGSVAASLKGEAMAALEHCISKGADHVDAAGLLGLALIDSEDTFGEAIGLMHRASAVEPGHAAIQYGLGVLGMVQGQCAGAHAAFSNALATDPAMPGAKIMQRVIAHAMAPRDAMAEAFADLEPDDYLIVAPVLRMALGNVNLPQDIRSIYETLALHTATQLAAAAVRVLNGGDAARPAVSAATGVGGRYLSQANQLVDGLVDVDIGAGLMLFENANFELAMMAFESGLAVDPGNEIANRMLDLSRLAEGKGIDNAAADYHRVGVVYSRNRIFEKAEEFFRQAIERDPEDAQAARDLSEMLAWRERCEA